MKTIQEIDKNLAVKSGITRENVKFYDVCENPFKVYGLSFNNDNGFHRMPPKVAKTVNDGVYSLQFSTAGGRVRFVTDSPYIAIHAEMPKIGKMPHFALTGSAGFDLFATDGEEQEYLHTFVPPFEIENGYESEFIVPRAGMLEYTLNFPLYSNVSKLYIVLDGNAHVEAPSAYKYEKPVVFYGSSITQGGCASRPGNSYQSVISRHLDCDFINLGFSGSAHGEKEMAEYIAGLDMSIFVYDYDYNAPDAEHLKETHEPMFKIIRAAQPELPIICVSRPDFSKYDDSAARRRVITDTVNHAKAAGDKNVFFVDGESFSKELSAGDGITVDGCHPNDLGFLCMANVIGRAIEDILINR